MEEELDLRPYLGALFKKWWWIVGAGILFGLLAVVVASIRPDYYQASALVAVLEPTQEVQFDPRFANLQTRNTLLKAYPELARSDEILQQLLASAGDTNQMTMAQLRSSLTAEPGNEPSLIYFRATNTDPAMAAELANEWATLFVDTANKVYGVGSEDRLSFYKAQLADSRTRLAESEQQLIDFQTENRLSIVTNELDSLNQLQADYLAGRNALKVLQDDINALREQIDSTSNDAGALSQQLTALALQSRAYSLQEALPVVLQVDAADLADLTQQQQIEFLAALSSGIDDRLALIDQQLIDLEPQILDSQHDKQQLTAEGTALQRDRDLLTETFTALSRKVDEEIITTQDTSSGFRLASLASQPSSPAGGSTILIALLGAAFGMILASLVIILQTWWRS